MTTPREHRTFDILKFQRSTQQTREHWILIMNNQVDSKRAFTTVHVRPWYQVEKFKKKIFNEKIGAIGSDPKEM